MKITHQRDIILQGDSGGTPSPSLPDKKERMKQYFSTIANLAHKCIQFKDGEMTGYDMTMFESLLPILSEPFLKSPSPNPDSMKPERKPDFFRLIAEAIDKHQPGLSGNLRKLNALTDKSAELFLCNYIWDQHVLPLQEQVRSLINWRKEDSDKIVALTNAILKSEEEVKRLKEENEVKINEMNKRERRIWDLGCQAMMDEVFHRLSDGGVKDNEKRIEYSRYKDTPIPEYKSEDLKF